MSTYKCGWVTVPVRFYIEAKSDEVFNHVVRNLPKEVWESSTSSEGYSVDSERSANKRGKYFKEKSE